MNRNILIENYFDKINNRMSNSLNESSLNEDTIEILQSDDSENESLDSDSKLNLNYKLITCRFCNKEMNPVLDETISKFIFYFF